MICLGHLVYRKLSGRSEMGEGGDGNKDISRIKSDFQVLKALSLRDLVQGDIRVVVADHHETF